MELEGSAAGAGVCRDHEPCRSAGAHAPWAARRRQGETIHSASVEKYLQQKFKDDLSDTRWQPWRRWLKRRLPGEVASRPRTLDSTKSSHPRSRLGRPDGVPRASWIWTTASRSQNRVGAPLAVRSSPAAAGSGRAGRPVETRRPPRSARRRPSSRAPAADRWPGQSRTRACFVPCMELMLSTSRDKIPLEPTVATDSRGSTNSTRPEQDGAKVLPVAT